MARRTGASEGRRSLSFSPEVTTSAAGGAGWAATPSLPPVGALGSAPMPLVASDAPNLPQDLALYLDEVERNILLRALDRHRFNRTAAGAALGLSLRQMRYRMARLGITEAGAADGGET